MRFRKTTNKSLVAVVAQVQNMVAQVGQKRQGLVAMEARQITANVFKLRWHTAFIAKSLGNADEFGNVWPPLAAATVARKRAQNSPGIRADRQAQWYRRRQQFIQQFRAQGLGRAQAVVSANALAWQSMSAAGGVPINVDSTDLEQSLLGGANHVEQFSGNTLTLGSSVFHGQFVNAKRRFRPNPAEMRVWLVAVADGIRMLVFRELRQRL